MAKEMDYKALYEQMLIKNDKLKLKLEASKEKESALKEKNKKLREKVADMKHAMDPEAHEKAKKVAEKKKNAKTVSNVNVDGETLDFNGLSEQIKEHKKNQTIQLKSSEITKETFRFVVDRFYDAQKKRIVLSNQIDSIERGTDTSDDASMSILKMEYAIYIQLEDMYKKIMDVCTKRTRSGRWLREVSGVGPALAATFEAYLDVTKGKHASSFQSFCGLNDHSKPWYSKDFAKKIVKDAMEKCETSVVNDDVIIHVAASTKWSVEFLKEHCVVPDAVDGEGNPVYDKTALEKAIVVLPYNRNLKTACWKLADCFVKNANRKSLYGKIYQERKSYEIEKNENGEYEEAAALALQKKNYTGDTRKTYESGKLPLSHIEQRARRYAVKMFISHYYEASYLYHYGVKAERPYAIEHLGHSDYIGPEVPYDSVD